MSYFKDNYFVELLKSNKFVRSKRFKVKAFKSLISLKHFYFISNIKLQLLRFLEPRLLSLCLKIPLNFKLIQYVI